MRCLLYYEQKVAINETEPRMAVSIIAIIPNQVDTLTISSG
jgi:hypothetical protein